MATPITRGFDLALFDARFTPFTMDAAKNRTVVWDKITSPKDGNDRSMFPDPTAIRTHDFFGVGPMVEAYEYEPFAFDQPIKGHTKQTSYRKFAKGVEFTEEFLQDALFSAGDQIAGSLGGASSLTKDLEIARMLDNANNTTYYTAQDGLALGSGSHTLSSGSGVTHRNTPSVSAGLSYLGTQDMLTLMYRQTDERGYPDPACMPGGTIIVVHQPEDIFIVDKLFGDGAENEPDTPNRNKNVIKNAHSWQFINNPYCTGTGAAANGTNRLWHMIIPDREFVWYVSKQPLSTSTYMENKNKSMIYDARERYAFHVKDWRGFYTNGA